jgi:hypothetical protein
LVFYVFHKTIIRNTIRCNRVSFLSHPRFRSRLSSSPQPLMNVKWKANKANILSPIGGKKANTALCWGECPLFTRQQKPIRLIYCPQIGYSNKKIIYA